MDEMMARTMVETLAKGIDPISGLALPNNHLCNNEEMQEALEIVLKNCTIESYKEQLAREKEERAEQRRLRYPNQGRAWEEEEERRVIALNQKYNIWYSAAVLGRSPSAITHKLKALGRKPNKTRKK